MTTLKLYRSYSFKDKDPVIDHVRAIIEKENLSYAKVSLASGVSTSTLYNWFDGETRRPQFATVMAIVRSLGYDFTLAPVEHKLPATAKIIAFSDAQRLKKMRAA
jgi:DNA-binding phage protein